MNMIFINYHLYQSMSPKMSNDNFIVGAIIGEIMIDIPLNSEKKIYLSVNSGDEIELNIQNLLDKSIKIYTEGDLKGIKLSCGILKESKEDGDEQTLSIEMRDIFPKRKSIPGDLSFASKNQELRMEFIDYYEHTSTIHFARKK